MMAEIYLWSEPYGFGPDQESKDWIRTELGGDSPVDVGLRGGETLRLGLDWRVEFLHLPGHTPGHLGIWDAKNDAAIIIDAALEEGIYDREGNLPQPPRYFDATAYQKTIRKLHSMLLAISLRPTTSPCGMRTPLTSSTAHSISPCESNGWSAKG